MKNNLVNLQETLEKVLKNTLPPSHIFGHSNMMGYHTSVDNYSTVGRELQKLTGAINKTIFKRLNGPS